MWRDRFNARFPWVGQTLILATLAACGWGMLMGAVHSISTSVAEDAVSETSPTPAVCNHRIGQDCSPVDVDLPPDPGQMREPDWCDFEPRDCRRYMDYLWDHAG